MNNLIEVILHDWRRYIILHKKRNILFLLLVFFHNPGMLFSLIYRIENYLFSSQNTLLHVLGWVLYPGYFLWGYYILDVCVPPRTKIGKGLYIHNKGIVVDETAIIGENATFIGPITIGRKAYLNKERSAKIGDNTIIYSGARILGPITIGKNVSIGANAVVTKNIPGNVIVGGVPAKIIKRIK